MNLNRRIITYDEIEKVVADLLLYIEKETDIQFAYETIGGKTELISIESDNSETPSISCSANIYNLDSYNYPILFVFYLCKCEGVKKIIEIALLPFKSESDDEFMNASRNLTLILPNIPVNHHLRKSEKQL